MDSATDFKNSSTIVSEMKQNFETGLQGQCIWELNDWNKNFAFLRANSFCTIKVGSDQKHAIRLYFGVNDHQAQTSGPDPERPNYVKQTGFYVPLFVELKMSGCNSPVIDFPVIVSIDVHHLSESLVSENIFASGSVTFKLGDSPRGMIIGEFLEIAYTSMHEEDWTRNCASGYSQKPENLRFGITATISPINETLTTESANIQPETSLSNIEDVGNIYKSVVSSSDFKRKTKENGEQLHGNKPTALQSHEGITPEAAFMEQFKKMYKCDSNFPDLKLETKDNMTLSTHKFVVAARSSTFHEIVKMETEKDGFSGTIKIDVDAKPMLAILHWMYTGEIYDKADLVMEQVIKAAKKFDLPELLKILDKEMIGICTVENMFSLYQVAKKCGMLAAVKDIGEFIKSNV